MARESRYGRAVGTWRGGWTVVALALALAAPARADEAAVPARPFRAPQVFDVSRPILFQDDFAGGTFGRWNFSEDDRYRLLRETPERLRVVEAPGRPGCYAVRCFVPRAPNSFRAEISLPHESGWQERWYGERLLIPADWVPDATRGHDLVMQWHAIPGNGKPTNPNLEISVGGTNWFVRQTYGEPPDHKRGGTTMLPDPVRPGAWVRWVIHARWSPRADGLIQIWQDDRLVFEREGTNVYTNLGVDYTPYLKTGLYRPEWHTDTPEKRALFDRIVTAVSNKTVYVTDVKVGDARAGRGLVAPAP